MYQWSRPKPAPPLLFHSHRRNSFRASDIDEIVEIRARQRTFDGAYVRTALSTLGYACLILKVFSTEFAKGQLPTVLRIDSGLHHFSPFSYSS